LLGSKPQLATTEKLVRWAKRADCQKTRALGYARYLPNYFFSNYFSYERCSNHASVIRSWYRVSNVPSSRTTA